MRSSGILSGEFTAYAFCDALLADVHHNPDYEDAICAFEDEQMTWWYDPELHEEGWTCPDCGTPHSTTWDPDPILVVFRSAREILPRVTMPEHAAHFVGSVSDMGHAMGLDPHQIEHARRVLSLPAALA